jgi:SET domain-containing protein
MQDWKTNMSWTVAGAVEIRELYKGGVGVFATRIIEPGEVIGIFQGVVHAFPLRENGPDYGSEDPHMMLDLYDDGNVLYALTLPDIESPVNRVNHSCSPNCKLAGIHGLTMIAARQILPGEELYFDYRPVTLRPIMLDCWCHAPGCLL